METIAKIKSQADLTALKASRKEFGDLREVLKQTGGDTEALDKKIAKIDLALESEKARAIEAVAALERHARALRANGEDATIAERQIFKLQKQFGVKRSGFLAQARKEFAGLLTDIPGVGRASQALTNVFGTLRLSVLGVVAAVVGLIGAIAKGLKIFDEKRDAVDALNQSLANAGEFTDELAGSYQRLATDLQRATGIADSQWLKTIQKLVQFGGDPRSVGVDVEAVKNLAGLFEGDVARATDVYTQAIIGQTEELENVGIVLDSTMSKTERMAQLQRLLAERGTGLLEAKTRTLSGQLGKVGNEISDLLGALGSWASGNRLVNSTLAGLGNALEWWNDRITATIPALDGLRSATRDTSRDVDLSAAAVTAYGEKLDRDLTAKAEKAAAALAKLTDEISRQQAEADRVADAKLALNIAKLEARTDLTDTEKLVVEQQLRQQAATERFKRAQAADEQRIQANNKFADNRATEARQAGQRVQTLEQGLELTRERERAEAIRNQTAAQVAADRAELERLRRLQEPGLLNPLTNSPADIYEAAIARREFQRAQEEDLPAVQNRLRQRLNLLRQQNARLAGAEAAEMRFDRAVDPETASLSASSLAQRLTQERDAAQRLAAEARQARSQADERNGQIRSEMETDQTVRGLNVRRQRIEDRTALTASIAREDTGSGRRAEAAAEQVRSSASSAARDIGQVFTGVERAFHQVAVAAHDLGPRVADLEREAAQLATRLRNSESRAAGLR